MLNWGSRGKEGDRGDRGNRGYKGNKGNKGNKGIGEYRYRNHAFCLFKSPVVLSQLDHRVFYYCKNKIVLVIH